MDKVHVAVIDDGVNEEAFYNIGKLTHSIEVTDQDRIVQADSSGRCELSHGTICAAILKQYAPDVRMSSVKILHDLRGTKEKLVSAIKWCIRHKVDVVNLSLGTENYMDCNMLRALVNDAYSEGIIIVAASSNRNVITYPASLSNVIGVKCDQGGELKPGQYRYCYYEMDGIDIVANSVRRLAGKYNIAVEVPRTNSYAAPLVTALVSKLINTYKIKNIEFIRQKLSDSSQTGDEQSRFYNPFLCTGTDWAGKAVLFEIGETEQPVYGAGFNIAGVFFIKSEEELLTVMKQYFCQYEVQLRAVDTVIIHIGKSCSRGIAAQRLIEYISHKGKNIIYLNDNYRNDSFNMKDIKLTSKLYHPILQGYRRIPKPEDSALQVPIILVCNHAHSMIFDKLYLLQKLFRDDGYYAAVITDKSNGLLYDISYIPTAILYKKGSINRKLLDFHEKKYNTDIIIIETDRFSSALWRKTKVDVIIDIFLDKIYFNNKIFPYEGMEKVYINIMEYFSGKEE